MVDSNYTAASNCGTGILCEYKIPACVGKNREKDLLIIAHERAIMFFELDDNNEPHKCITGVDNEFDRYKLGKDGVEVAVQNLAENCYKLIQKEIEEHEFDVLQRTDEALKFVYTNALFSMCISR